MIRLIVGGLALAGVLSAQGCAKSDEDMAREHAVNSCIFMYLSRWREAVDESAQASGLDARWDYLYLWMEKLANTSGDFAGNPNRTSADAMKLVEIGGKVGHECGKVGLAPGQFDNDKLVPPY